MVPRWDGSTHNVMGLCRSSRMAVLGLMNTTRRGTSFLRYGTASACGLARVLPLLGEGTFEGTTLLREDHTFPILEK